LIAHELHDEFRSVSHRDSQSRAGDCNPGRRARPGDRGCGAADLGRSRALYDAMHGLIPRLTPLSLDTSAWPPRSRVWFATGSGAIRRLPCRCTGELPIELGPSVTLAIYRVVQEGLINALRHAQASRVDIAVQCDTRRSSPASPTTASPSADWARPGHFGLRGLAERVRQLGGTFSIRRHDGRGVRLSGRYSLGLRT